MHRYHFENATTILVELPFEIVAFKLLIVFKNDFGVMTIRTFQYRYQLSNGSILFWFMSDIQRVPVTADKQMIFIGLLAFILSLAIYQVFNH